MSAAGAPKLELDQVTRRFGGIQAVRRLSMHASRGEILGLIGPNGAGKSTVLSLIAGEQAVSAGRIRLDGVPIEPLPHFRRVRAGVAFVRQHAANLDRASVSDNVLLATGARGPGAALGGWWRFAVGGAAPTASERDKALAILDRVGLAARGRDLAGSLSHREKRLLSLARALATNPTLMLLDEPLAGLSAAETAEVVGIIKGLREEQGNTFVIAEHNVDVMLRLCDHIVALHFGESIAYDVPERIAKHPRVIDVYLGAS